MDATWNARPCGRATRTHASVTKHFSAVVKTHKHRSNKIYKTKITKIKIENQVMCKYRVDPQRAGSTSIAELTWSNLGLKEVLKK